MERTVCHFSCGAASAVATQLILKERRENVLIVNAFIAEEHPDNRRFLRDCRDWFDRAAVAADDAEQMAELERLFGLDGKQEAARMIEQARDLDGDEGEL